ncbi:MAG: phosphatidylcholine synthase [Candidatus Hydrogenedentes bacterium]|nr:phosphatidylcholine synthase [Candidatus Hydrogenedentota bacterium]
MRLPFRRTACISTHLETPQAAPVAPWRKAAAWSVHLLTAVGAVAGFFALIAIADARWMDAFAWMGLTVLIDGVDGLFARMVGVRRILPGIDGALLDNIVDYFTYVVIPAFFVYEADFVPDSWRVPVAAAMILSSAYQFCQVDAKTADHFFTGWPSYWNVAVFYLFVFDANPLLNLVLLLTCAILVFVPVRYLYPSRAERFRVTCVLLTLVWAVTLVVMWFQYPVVHISVTALSIAYVVFYYAVSLFATLRQA